MCVIGLVDDTPVSSRLGCGRGVWEPCLVASVDGIRRKVEANAKSWALASLSLPTKTTSFHSQKLKESGRYKICRRP